MSPSRSMETGSTDITFALSRSKMDDFDGESTLSGDITKAFICKIVKVFIETQMDDFYCTSTGALYTNTGSPFLQYK